jgi:hypothetical protein
LSCCLCFEKAQDFSVLKAVSQNLMHESLTVTNRVYGILSETSNQEQIDIIVDLIVERLRERIINPDFKNPIQYFPWWA